MGGGVMTEDHNPFEDVFAAWMNNRIQQQDVDDDEAERLNEQEEALLDQIVNTRARMPVPSRPR
jgi:hypothetical protein